MMVDEPDYDVVVVGGGPAGVSCAYTLAKFNRSVILLDKKRHDQIGNKTCGDALDKESPLILNKAFGLELPKDDEISDLVSKMSIVTKNKTITLRAPGYTVDRLKYGQRLLHECTDLGVVVVDNASVREIIIEDNFVKGVKYYRNGELNEIRGKLIADCSGIIGAIRRNLPKGFSDGITQRIDDHHIAASFREIVSLKRDHQWEEEIVLTYAPSIPPPGYLWFFSKGKKKLNIGTGWLKSENKLFDRSMKEIYRAALDEYMKKDVDYTIDIAGGGQIPIRPPFDCLTFNGGVLIGDAGCLVDPTTAEGHGPALVAGYYAGRAMNNAIKNGDLSREGLWQYNIDVMAHYGRRNAISYITLQFLRHIEADGMDFILRRKILTEQEVKDVFDGLNPKTGFFSTISKIIHCFPKYGLLMDMYNLVKRVKKMGNIYDQYPSDPNKLSEWREERDALLEEKL